MQGINVLNIIDDGKVVCDHCLDNRFIRRDRCGEYYLDSVEMHDVNDMSVCEYCREEMVESDVG